jgi:hypothetical protein
MEVKTIGNEKLEIERLYSFIENNDNGVLHIGIHGHSITPLSD